ncbi:50S ribosomal protein L25 [Fimbriimonas ginsengisoli]|uniref:Ribosomal 5S rRNA E-loop binding protein Ctc/L25/TL5 n=1 Tax=Fimbriimonas ginsengisoli Gsoil 348 TaxID=661478 RepID=A0A068NUK5_FIMGI|nr:50S ribosomal protein L25 [Fimbriimonas ginsengisoli]AIE85299.1 ribosomal 5S rRNA E-loop binding protein Ctc/L25/TL5 [Fimbriimonas ginsengisoli Gsoil 348]
MSMFQVERRQKDGGRPKQLRKRGVLPMALVERTHETMLIQAPVDALRHAMAHVDSHGRMQIQIGGEGGSRQAIVKHVEQDALRHELIHVTLQEVADEDTIKMDIPVVATGHSAATDESGVALNTITDHIKIRGRIMDMPEHIEVDISNMGVGDHITAGDLKLADGVELLSNPDTILFSVSQLRIAQEEPETTASAEEEPTETASDSTEES